MEMELAVVVGEADRSIRQTSTGDEAPGCQKLLKGFLKKSEKTRGLSRSLLPKEGSKVEVG